MIRLICYEQLDYEDKKKAYFYVHPEENKPIQVDGPVFGPELPPVIAPEPAP
jgi:hypothetical protein